VVKLDGLGFGEGAQLRALITQISEPAAASLDGDGDGSAGAGVGGGGGGNGSGGGAGALALRLTGYLALVVALGASQWVVGGGFAAPGFLVAVCFVLVAMVYFEFVRDTDGGSSSGGGGGSGSGPAAGARSTDAASSRTGGGGTTAAERGRARAMSAGPDVDGAAPLLSRRTLKLQLKGVLSGSLAIEPSGSATEGDGDGTVGLEARRASTVGTDQAGAPSSSPVGASMPLLPPPPHAQQRPTVVQTSTPRPRPELPAAAAKTRVSEPAVPAARPTDDAADPVLDSARGGGKGGGDGLGVAKGGGAKGGGADGGLLPPGMAWPPRVDDRVCEPFARWLKLGKGKEAKVGGWCRRPIRSRRCPLVLWGFRLCTWHVRVVWHSTWHVRVGVGFGLCT
jgi:hypothetical protein